MWTEKRVQPQPFTACPTPTPALLGSRKGLWAGGWRGGMDPEEGEPCGHCGHRRQGRRIGRPPLPWAPGLLATARVFGTPAATLRSGR